MITPTMCSTVINPGRSIFLTFFATCFLLVRPTSLITSSSRATRAAFIGTLHLDGSNASYAAFPSWSLTCNNSDRDTTSHVKDFSSSLASSSSSSSPSSSSSSSSSLLLSNSNSSFTSSSTSSGCLFSTLRFEFTSESSDALLLYTDNSGDAPEALDQLDDFVQLRLVSGSVELRHRRGNDDVTRTATVASLSGGLKKASQGRALKWHQVVARLGSSSVSQTTLFVQELSPSSTNPQFRHSDDFDVNKVTSNSRSNNVTTTYNDVGSCDDDVKGGRTLNAPVGAPTHYSFTGFLYVGGVPTSFRSEPWRAALTSVAFEPHLSGSIRNLFYIHDCVAEINNNDMSSTVGRTDDAISSGSSPIIVQKDMSTSGQVWRAGVRTISMISSAGTRNESEGKFCADEQEESPCRNGGICRSTDKGPLCLCERTGYTGARCSIRDGAEHLIVSLKDACIHVKLVLGSGTFETEVKSDHGARVRFNDDNLHNVVVLLKTREIEINVDNVYRRVGTLVGKFSMIPCRVFYCGGMPTSASAALGPIHTVDNFTGCLSQITLRANSIFLNIINLAFARRNDNRSLIKSVGSISWFGCDDQNAVQPITFTTESAFLKLPRLTLRHLNEDSSTGFEDVLEFSFRTTELDGLLFYSFMEARNSRWRFLAFQILSEFLYCVMDLISGRKPLRILLSHSSVSNGLSHHVRLMLNSTTVSVECDGMTQHFPTNPTPSSTPFHSHNAFQPLMSRDVIVDMFIGGAGMVDVGDLHPMLTRVGYIGCIYDVILDDRRVDLVALVREQESDGVITSRCHRSEPVCDSTMFCRYGGICRDGWAKSICDCSTTGHRGPNCEEEVTTLRFNGQQFVHVSSLVPLELGTSSQLRVTLRFRTTMTDGLIYHLSSDTRSSHSLLLVLDSARIRLDVKLGTSVHKQSLMSERLLTLNDKNWHTVIVQQRDETVSLTVDHYQTSTVITSKSSPAAFKYHFLDVGQKSSNRNINASRNITHRSTVTKTNSRITRESAPVPPERVGYQGQMQQLTLSGNELFEMVRRREFPGINTTADIVAGNAAPINFASLSSYLITKVQLSDLNSFRFKLKTLQKNGLMLYASTANNNVDGNRRSSFFINSVTAMHSGSNYTGNISDNSSKSNGDGTFPINSAQEDQFIAVELFDGGIHYVRGYGSSLMQVQLLPPQPINDSLWHDVIVTWHNSSHISLHVDSSTRTEEMGVTTKPEKMSSMTGILKTDNVVNLYVGGVPKGVFTIMEKQIRSRHGFQGCISGVHVGTGDQNDVLDLTDANIPAEYERDVSRICENSETECHPTSCDNGGLCIQGWGMMTCDCDLTSFTGPTCTDDSIAYSFGTSGGTITFTYPREEEQSTRRDVIALGFSTSQADTILARINGNMAPDTVNTQYYIQMELIDGSIFVTYNLGLKDQRVGSLQLKVNDGAYHVAWFIRSGANVSLRIDDNPVFKFHPTGLQRGLFSNQSKITIGGQRDELNRLKHYFSGLIVGLVVNGLRILDLASEGDHRIKIEGDIQLDNRPIKLHQIFPFSSTTILPLIPSPLRTTSATFATSLTSMTKNSLLPSTTVHKKHQEYLTDDLILSDCQPDSVNVNCDNINPTSDAFILPITKLATSQTRLHKHQSSATPFMTSSSRDILPCEPYNNDEDCNEAISGHRSVRPTTADIFILKHSTTDLSRHLASTGVNTPVTPSTSQMTVRGMNMTSMVLNEQESESTLSTRKLGTSILTNKNQTSSITPTHRLKLSFLPSDDNESHSNYDEKRMTSRAEPSTIPKSNDYYSLAMNLALIISVALCMAMLVAMILCMVSRFRRPQNVSQLAETKVFLPNGCNSTEKPLIQVNGYISAAQTLTTMNVAARGRTGEVVEWYV